MNERETLRALQDGICAAWIDLLRQNRGAEGHPDDYYALTVENVRGHGEQFDLCLTFRTGRIYCCCEDMCHTGLLTKRRWQQLRAALAAHGVKSEKPLIVRIRTRLEAGARLRYGWTDDPEPEMHDQGPWTLTVREPPRVAPVHHEGSSN
ncbi:hypothetical protein HL666_25465 [Bradyrhizobium sp. 83002]|uniref:hypothetical protein n=1 Tax=Bradyrhizobium aeschynomenes TaxID=2734909 RepID=UPI0015532E36|nr:hypothetical protein [Bradyrhizobium aeschynomenes]NPU14121.1 hypothetical protein [Bradyrhizobium aeschynomenes]